MQYTTTDGVNIEVVHVPQILVDMMTAEIPDPPVPTFKNQSTGQIEENPNHPDYQRQLEEVQKLRSDRIWDAYLSLGVKLEDEIPPTEEWLPRLKEMLAFLNQDVLGRYDLENPRDIDILFKRYFVVVTLADIVVVRNGASVTASEVATAMKSFRSGKG